VEPDYLPDAEVLCFQPCLYPMKYLHPRSMYTLPCGGVQRGGTPSADSIPSTGGSGGKRAPSIMSLQRIMFVSSSLEKLVILFSPLLSQSDRQRASALSYGKLVMSYFVTYNLKHISICLSSLFLIFDFKNDSALNILSSSTDPKIMV
jgi:hypothetical protein